MDGAPKLEHQQLKFFLDCLKRRYTKPKNISRKLKVSEKTIFNITKTLNQLFEKKIEIIYDNKLGFNIKINNQTFLKELLLENKKENYVFNDLNHRAKFIIKYLIDNPNSKITIDDLSEILSIGRTTCISDLKQVEKLLKPYPIILNKKQNAGLSIYGDELNIRLIIYNLLITSLFIDIESSNYYTIQKDIMNNLIIDIEYWLKEKNISLNEYSKNQIITFISIGVYRIKQGHKCQNTIHPFFEKFKPNLDFINELISIIEKHLKISFKLEKHYLSILFVTGIILDGYKLYNLNNDFFINLWDLINNNIHTQTGLILHEPQIEKSLIIHLKYMLARSYFNIDPRETMLENVENNYKLPYRLALITKSCIESKFKINISEREIEYITIYFGGFLENKQNKLYNIKKIALVLEDGSSMHILAKAKLKQLLSPDCQIDCFNSFKEMLDSHQNHSLILTSPTIKYKNGNYSVVILEDLYDLISIRNKLEQVLYFDHFMINQLEKISFILMFLNSKNILISKTKNLSIDNCFKVIDQHLRNNYQFDNQIINSILLKEKQYPTYFHNGVMFPHTTCPNIKEPMILLFINNNGISYKANKLFLIFVLLLPEKYEFDADLIVKIYDEILEICYDKDLITNLSKLNHPNEIKKLIKWKVNS